MKWVVLASLAAAVAARAAEPTAYALIVANNRSVDPDVAPLRYADDDGARYYEFFKPWAREVRLLAVLDDESHRLHREVARVAAPPTRTELLRALADLDAQMKADRDAGREPTLYFVFVGHGNVGPNREGYVSLLDGAFTRTDLFREVATPSQAAYLHLIVDACQSYFLVNARGALPKGESYAEAVKAYLADAELTRHPNVGVILSTARENESHEWSGFGAGVFSHQVRSALLGAADANGDGRIEYSELRAFVAAANLQVDDPRAKLEIEARPPALDRQRPIVDLASARFPRFVVVPPSASGRYSLEDDRGVRLADFHKALGGPLAMALPRNAPYFVRRSGAEARIESSSPRVVDAAGLRWQIQAVAARGALHETFQRRLFEAPYGEAFYRAFAASTGDVPAPPSARPLLVP